MTPDSIGETAASAQPRNPSSPRVADLLTEPAHQHPQATALVVTADRIAITYRDLQRLVDDLAGQLRRNGLVRGDRVGLRAANNAEFVVALLAASRAGLIVVPLDPALPVVEQHARIATAGARVMLVDDSGAGATALSCWPVSVTASHAGAVTVDVDATAAARPAPPTLAGLTPEDALIMFTGGTTGSPKLVPWTRENVSSSVSGIIASYQLGPQDATVAVMPLYHGHGLIAALLSTLASGGSVLLPARGRFSAHTFWDDIEAIDATWFTAVPTIHQILLQRAATDPPENARARLRFIRSCSAALSPETAGGLRTAFGVPVLSAYGMTEATHQVTSTRIAPDETTLPAGLVGRSSGADIRIAADDGTPRPPDNVGEVWLRGRTVVRGYLGDEAATARTFTDGWLRTGDLGSLSAEGDLTLRGRIKELINRGGEKISPERVEAVLAGHPNVVEVAVFGVPDPLYGETVAAAFVPARPASSTPAELADFCRDRLAAFEVPVSFKEVSALPHTAKGSIDRRAVGAQFSANS